VAKDIFIIAEGAANHNGDISIAERLIREARACGTDAVKFQTFVTENLIRKDYKKTAHLKNIRKTRSVFDAIKSLELEREEYLRLKRIARKEGVLIFSSVFDVESLHLINEVGFPLIKIPSGEIVNLELLDEASRCGKPIILSTGMATLEETKRAVEVISRNLRPSTLSNKQLIKKYPVFNKGLVLMHTVSTYPARPDELNLKAIPVLKKAFNVPVGYSDHTIGNDACVAATILGAELLEKHFTLDKNMDGPDHKASAEPAELKNLILKIRTAIKMVGDGEKRPSKSEEPMLKVFRRAIVARDDIPAGTVINKGNVIFKRPLDGIPIERFKDIDGMRTRVAIIKDTPILDKYLL
jgi:sialic acid synthase SpsE